MRTWRKKKLDKYLCTGFGRGTRFFCTPFWLFHVPDLPFCIHGLAEGEGFKRPACYVASLSEHSTQGGPYHSLNALLSAKQNKPKQNFYCASMLYAGRQRSVLNCISSEYQVNHGALFIAPEPALCDEHGERSSLPGKGKDEAGWQQHHQAKDHVGLEQTGLFLPYMISYLQPSASNCFHQSLFP